MSENKKQSKSSFWVKLMRFMAYAGIVCGCLFSLILGCTLIFRGDPDNRVLAVIVGLLIIAVGALLSLLGAAAVMVFLDMANDLRAIRQKTEEK